MKQSSIKHRAEKRGATPVFVKMLYGGVRGAEFME